MTQTPRPTPTPPKNPPQFDLGDLSQFAGMLTGAADDAKVVWLGQDAKGKAVTGTVKSLADTFVESVFNADDPHHADAINTFQSLFNSGAFGSNPTKQSVYTGIRRIYLDSANIYQGGKGRKVDPMTNYANNLAVLAQYTQSSPIRKDVSSYTDAQATQLGKDAFAQSFGRTPTAAELTTFKKSLLAAASAAPRITKTTSTGTVTSGGFDQNTWVSSYMSGLLPHEKNQADLSGTAGALQDKVNQTLQQYGIAADPVQVLNSVRDLMKGSLTEDALVQQAQGQAKAKFGVGMAAAIDAGNTVQQVVSPLLSRYASLMEVNPDAVKVGDIAAMASDESGQRLLTENEFVNKVKQKPEWLRTTNAKNEAYDLGNSILRMFGVVK